MTFVHKTGRNILQGYMCRLSLCHRTLSTRPQTMRQMRSSLLQMMQKQKEWLEKTDKQSIMASLPTDQSELPKKTMKDSYLESCIPLSDENEPKKLKYLAPNKLVRFGRLLEDLDTFAVACSYEHNKDQTHKPDEFHIPRACWTVLVDRIDLQPEFRTIANDKDIRLSGHVTWVGRSSMEVTVQVQQETTSSNMVSMLDAVFVMVARNPLVNKASLVCPLVATNEQERQILMKSEALQQERRKMSDVSLLKMAPSEQERQLIHDIFLNTLDPHRTSFKIRVKPEGTFWMDETSLKTCRICFPEQKNLYDKIFGGFLMRQAYELAWANACLYSKNRCTALAVDDVVFKAPVSIGSFLFLSSQVGYTEDHRMQVRVNAEVLDPQTREKTATNEFHFTLETSDKQPVGRVVPKTYAESMIYLDSRRRFYEAVSSRASSLM